MQHKKQAERVLNVCQRYSNDFSLDELVMYLRGHVEARPSGVVFHVALAILVLVLILLLLFLLILLLIMFPFQADDDETTDTLE